MTNLVPEVPGLYGVSDLEGAVRLIAGRCAGCSAVFFPSHAELHRPGCVGGAVESLPLPSVGVLASYTVQRFAPPEPFPTPSDWQPMPLGTVIFDPGIQIPGAIIRCDVNDLRIGMPLMVVEDLLYVDDEQISRSTWKFRPVASKESGGE